MFGTTTRPGFARPATVVLAFVVLLVSVALAAFLATAVAAGVGPAVLGVLALAVGVTVLTAMPFVFVRAMGDLGLE